MGAQDVGGAIMSIRTKTYKCNNCGDPFTARIADRARGWARFCSKSCKASRQTKDTGIGRYGKPINENFIVGAWEDGK